LPHEEKKSGKLLLMRAKTRLREAKACFREAIEAADRHL
jgi:hypothetical protein